MMTSPFGLREEPFDIENPLRAPFASADHKEAFNGFFLALMARRRVMALFGETGMGKTTLLRSLIRHIETDGSVVLAVTARPGMTVEDLLLAAEPDIEPETLPTADGTKKDTADLEAVVNDIEERIEETGTGIFVVDDAHTLEVPVLADLIELASSDTETGRFLQVLVAGDHRLERKLAEPELEPAFRLHGVVHHLPPLERDAVEGFVRDRLRLAGATQQDVFLPSAVDAATHLSAGLPGVLGAICGQALQIAINAGRHRVDASHVHEAASVLGIETAPDIEVDIPDAMSYTEVREPVPVSAASPRAFAPGRHDDREEQVVRNPGTPPPSARRPPSPGHHLERRDESWPRSGYDGPQDTQAEQDGGGWPEPWPDLTAPEWDEGYRSHGHGKTRTGFAVAGLAAVVLAAGTGLALSLGGDGPLRSLYETVAGTSEPEPAGSGTTIAAAPPLPAAAGENLPAPASPPAIDSATSIPAVPAPVTPPPSTAAPDVPNRPATADGSPAPFPPATRTDTTRTDTGEQPSAEPDIGGGGDASDTQREMERLAARADRQIADKLLTTPVGDNAFETYERMVALMPGSPEAATILERIKDTYLTWASTAEERGGYEDARRFYERALNVDPDDTEAARRLQALENAAAAEQTVGGEPIRENDTEEAAVAAVPAPSQILRLPPGYEEPSDGAPTPAPAPAPAPASASEPVISRPDGFTSRDDMLAATSNPDILRSVIAEGHNLDHELSDGKTALMLAAERGRSEAVRMLLEAGAAPNARSRNGGTALMYAAGIGDNESIRALVRHGGAVNAMNVDGKTALMAAAQGRHTDTVRLLLDSGADMDVRTVQGRSALDYAEEAGDQASTTLLRLRGARSGDMSPASVQREGGPRPGGPIDLRAFKG